jgi:hypothetical protein
MELRKITKKAAIGETFTWLAAVFVIFFIMVLYLFFLSVMGIKKVYFEKDKITVEEGSPGNLAELQSFYSLLDTQIEFNGKNQTILDSMLDNLDMYFETSSEYPAVGTLIERYGVNRAEDISSVTRSRMLEEGFRLEDLQEIDKQRVILANLIRAELDNQCDEYFFLMPQGLITEQGLLASSTILGIDTFANTPEKLSKWTPTIRHKVTYRGKQIEIKYRQRNDC